VIFLLVLLLLGGAAVLLVPEWMGRVDRVGGLRAVPSGSPEVSGGGDIRERAGTIPAGAAGTGREADAATTPGVDGYGAAASAADESEGIAPGDSSGAVATAGSDSGHGADDAGERSSALPNLPLSRVVYFEPNRTYLTGAAREELDALLPVLVNDPTLALFLEGHTALFGTEEGRAEISRGRAEGVLAYLVERGWSPETVPEILWQGSREPVTRDRMQQHLNRRVEILLTRPE
jgi:outer membrane protein OmpA-like peptidoglycan-associated protein